MDNLCHTLVGAVLGKAGLEKRTPLATVTLLVGANLPDVDVLAYLWGPETALSFRRGWTHGVLALAVWPFVLTGIMLAWDCGVRRRRRPDAEPARAGALLLLATVAILTHPFLDWLNTYGMRWLMPFRDVWFYGDTLFIIDPWIWLALGLGVVLASRRGRTGRPRPERPARIALAAVAVYILVLGLSGLAARAMAAHSLRESGTPPVRLMAGPMFATPFRRQIVADLGDRYAVGTLEWLPRPAFFMDSQGIARNAEHPAVAAASKARSGAVFLHWARFPFFRIEERPGSWAVHMTDARYAQREGGGLGSRTVMVPRETGLNTATTPPPPRPRTARGSDP
jgi:inner membrane protein